MPRFLGKLGARTSGTIVGVNEMVQDEQPRDLSNRINRMRRRYQTEKPVISIQRAKFFTEKWRELETSGLPLGMRVAYAIKNVYEKMTHHLDPDDRLAGAWTEHFLGWPIDIERGLFNDVLKVELSKSTMLAYQTRAYSRFMGYLVRRHGPKGAAKLLKNSAGLGPTPVNVGLKTLLDREINAFAIDPADNRVLQKELLPYWRGRSVADRLAEELRAAGLPDGEMARFIDGVPNTPSKQVFIVGVGASIAAYQGHLVLDHESVLRLGLLEMRREVDERLAGLAETDGEGRDFLLSLAISLDGLMVFCRRLADRIEEALLAEREPRRKAELGRLLAICRRVPLHPAVDFREAVQALWTHRVAVELAHPDNVHAYGRLDQLLYPYYHADRAADRLSREEARELLEELLLKVMAQNIRPESNFLGNFYLRYEGSTPITLGGRRRDGADAVNDLTYLLLEAADRSKSVTSIVVRVHRDTPDELYGAVADRLAGGTASFSFMNDEVLIPAMERYGYAAEDARDYAITGCTDLLAPGKTGGMGFAGLLLGRLLDLTLHNGDARMLLGPIAGAGPRTGEPDSFADFAALLNAFFVQADHQVKLCLSASNLRDRVFADLLPAPMISAFIRGCADRRRDVTRGGADYNLTGINMINSLANVIDSLYVIRRLVYEEKRFSLGALVRATDENFVGHEAILAAVREVSGKWGNGEPECDALAREFTDRLFALVEKRSTFKGGPVAPFLNSMTSHTLDGRLSPATPDGRRAATPYAASCNPYNVERAGLTGVLRSVAALDFTRQLGCAVNIRQHPSALGAHPETRRKWIDLVRTYFRLGGAQLQPTVASADTLRAAQRRPDEHRDLIVKVGGYSTYFVDLGREIQDEIIARTEHQAT